MVDPAERCMYCDRRGVFRVVDRPRGGGAVTFDEIACSSHLRTLMLFAERCGVRDPIRQNGLVRRGGAL